MRLFEGYNTTGHNRDITQDVVKVISKTHGKELKFGGVMPLLGY